MRRPRFKAPDFIPVGYYHCVSRVVDRRFVLGTLEKEKFVEFMRLYARLYGLRILAYCVMSNHFHILVEVPRRPADENLPDDSGLVHRVRSCLGERAARKLEWQLAHFRSIGADAAAAALREGWFSRMWDISSFMKILKQRFSQWFNGRHDRCGTLWEDRYRSVLIEGVGNALRTIAAYIDLNPVRAGICDDPKDYRWCGYAEAVAGRSEARQAIEWLVTINPHGGHFSFSSDEVGSEILSEMDASEGGSVLRIRSREALRRWRCHLFGIPERLGRQVEQTEKGQTAEILQARIPREKALEVLHQGGQLPEADYLRCRIRYFTEGGAIGCRSFIEQLFRSTRESFGPHRKRAAYPLRGLEPDVHSVLHSHHGSDSCSEEGWPEASLHNLSCLRKALFR